jgi:hypothetical protein
MADCSSTYPACLRNSITVSLAALNSALLRLSSFSFLFFSKLLIRLSDLLLRKQLFFCLLYFLLVIRDTLLLYKRFHLSYYLNLCHRTIYATILTADLRNHKLPHKNFLFLSVQRRCTGLQHQKISKNLQLFLI